MSTFSPAALPLGEDLEQGVECRTLVDMSTPYCGMLASDLIC